MPEALTKGEHCRTWHSQAVALHRPLPRVTFSTKFNTDFPPIHSLWFGSHSKTDDIYIDIYPVVQRAPSYLRFLHASGKRAFRPATIDIYIYLYIYLNVNQLVDAREVTRLVLLFFHLADAVRPPCSCVRLKGLVNGPEPKMGAAGCLIKPAQTGHAQLS